jgi:hypothetical protein
MSMLCRAGTPLRQFGLAFIGTRIALFKPTARISEGLLIRVQSVPSLMDSQRTDTELRRCAARYANDQS